MSYKTIGDDWLEYAKLLPVGQQRRGNHDCKRGGKLALMYGNDASGWWAKCWRCGFRQFRPKTHVQYRSTATYERTPPSDVIPLVKFISENAYLMRNALEHHRLLPHISRLTISPAAGRIYLPDDSRSYCGLDYARVQYASWFSPFQRPLATHMGEGALHIVGDASAYLTLVRDGAAAVFLPYASNTGLPAMAHEVIRMQPSEIVIQHAGAIAVRRELALMDVPISIE